MYWVACIAFRVPVCAKTDWSEGHVLSMFLLHAVNICFERPCYSRAAKEQPKERTQIHVRLDSLHPRWQRMGRFFWLTPSNGFGSSGFAPRTENLPVGKRLATEEAGCWKNSGFLHLPPSSSKTVEPVPADLFIFALRTCGGGKSSDRYDLIAVKPCAWRKASPVDCSREQS